MEKASANDSLKLIWTAVEGLFDELHHPSSALSSTEDDGAQISSCAEFTCQGGQICVEQVRSPFTSLSIAVEGGP